MPPIRALPMLSMTAINASPINRSGSPNKVSTTSPKKGHARARSSSGSSSNSTGSGGSRAVAPFPTLIATSETVLEQNASDILWKTFVAFEQDCRDASNLLPLLASIEQTVSAAIDPISLAAECLEETANYIEGDIRDAIEQALIGAGSPSSTGSDSPRSQLSSPISHSKQFSLASNRLSSVCSTFRATQANLRYYGGARKTAYQLDVFVHKYALPTSTALHKRGQEISAAMKWLKKMLNNDGRMLDVLEMSALRRASNSLTYWAEGLKIHSEILRSAATAVKALMTERASLQAYAFPPKAGTSAPTGLATSPISNFTHLPFLPSPTALPNNFFDFPFISPPAGPSTAFPTSAQQSHAPMMMSLPTGLSSNPPTSASALPQSCAFNFVSSPGGSQSAFTQQYMQDPVASYFGSNLPQQPFSFGGTHTPDLSIPTDLFFDNLCM